MSQYSRALRQYPAHLPDGVALHALPAIPDGAGAMIELYRQDWNPDVVPVQWNLVSSRANTLRGVHVHLTHYDYLCMLAGEMLLGLHDMRPDSPSYRLSAQMLLRGDASVAIPPGVAHGFYFATEATYFYAVSRYWNPADELGCRWDDPQHGLSWPTQDPLLSPRDASAPSYDELVHALGANLNQRAHHS